MKVDQVRDSVNCRVDEVRYFVKIVDVVRVDQVGCSNTGCVKPENQPDINLKQKNFVIQWHAIYYMMIILKY